MNLKETWQRIVARLNSDLLPKLVVSLLVTGILGAGTSLISGLAAGAAAISVFFQAKELAEHQRQLKFEQSQRAIEILIKLTEFWNSTLDDDTRSRIAQLRTGRGSAVLLEMVDERNLADESTIERSAAIVGFLHDRGVKREQWIAELARYRTAVMKLLNAMDAIAHVRLYASEGEARDDISKRMIDEMFKNVVRLRSGQFKEFVNAYRATQEQRSLNAPKAWANLAGLVEDGDWKVTEGSGGKP